MAACNSLTKKNLMDIEQFTAEQQIVKNVRRLSNFIRDAYLQTEEEKFSTLRTDFNLFHKQLEMLFQKWFPKAKPCSDFEIVNRIFKYELENKDLKVWVKYSLACLLKTSERVLNNIIKYKEKKETVLLNHEMTLLYEIAFEAAIFIEDGYRIIENKTLDFGHGKRFSIYARETHNASEQILRKVVIPKSHGEFVAGSTSIFLLRQAIELWLKGIFGIQYISGKNNKALKLQPEILFNLIDSAGKKVQLPVPKSVIEKIHSWSQPYVHAGWLIHIWEIEHAQHVLRPIFYSSNIKIKKDHYENVESLLKKILKIETLVLHRNTRPECTISDK